MVAAALGALAIMVGHFLFTRIHYHSDAFLRDAYTQGYRTGQEWSAYFNGTYCLTAARGRYGETRGGPTPRGMRAFERGCNAAIEGRPADPEPPPDE